MNFVMCIAAATAGSLVARRMARAGCAAPSGASACVGLWAVAGVYSRWGSVKIVDGGLGEDWRQCGLRAATDKFIALYRRFIAELWRILSGVMANFIAGVWLDIAGVSQEVWDL